MFLQILNSECVFAGYAQSSLPYRNNRRKGTKCKVYYENIKLRVLGEYGKEGFCSKQVSEYAESSD
jgi:hypothetical protein